MAPAPSTACFIPAASTRYHVLDWTSPNVLPSIAVAVNESVEPVCGRAPASSVTAARSARAESIVAEKFATAPRPRNATFWRYLLFLPDGSSVPPDTENQVLPRLSASGWPFTL